MAFIFWLALIVAWSLWEHTWIPIVIFIIFVVVAAICMIADDVTDGID